MVAAPGILIDGGVFVGRDTRSSVSASCPEILSAMDSNGVGSAVVASFRAIFEDQDAGNREIALLAAQHRARIIPMAVVSPLSYVARRRTIRELARAGFRIIGAFPAYQSWPLPLFAFRRMAEEIAAEGLVLQVAVSNWLELDGTARSLDGLSSPVLIRWIRGGGYNYLTEEIALACRYENLFFDIGNVTTTGGIQMLCEEIGSERLFLCSNMPLAYERCAYYRLHVEKLDPDDRRLIRGGNLARLIGARK